MTLDEESPETVVALQGSGGEAVRSTIGDEPREPGALLEADGVDVAPATEPPRTGHEGVDAALALLADVDQQPVAHHAEVYEDVQGRLQHALADLDGR
jgi:hypothetical protein